MRRCSTSLVIREIKNQTALCSISHSLPLSQSENNKCFDKHLEKLEPSYTAGRILKCFTYFGKWPGSFTNVKHNYHMTQKLYSYMYIPKIIKTYAHNKNLNVNVLSNIIHTIKNVETTQMSIHRAMDKQNVGQLWGSIFQPQKGMQHERTSKTLRWLKEARCSTSNTGTGFVAQWVKLRTEAL